MKKINLLYICLFVFFQNTNAQNTFSKKIQLPFIASTFSSIVATDSCFYCIGVAIDTIGEKSYILPLFVKSDLKGNPQIIKVYKDKDKDTTDYLLFTPTLQFIDSDKYVITSGLTLDTSTKSTAYFKWDLKGNVVDIKRFGGLVEKCGSTNIYMVTSKDEKFHYLIDWATNLPCEKNFNEEYFVTKFDNSGKILWKKAYGSELRDIAYCAVEDTDGGLIIGGEKRNDQLIGKHYTWRNYIVKIDKDGNLIWEYLAPIEKKQWYHTTSVRAMAKTKDNGLVVAAHRAEEDDSVFPSNLLYEYMIYKLDSNRNLVWKTFMRPVYYAPFAQIYSMRALSDESGFVGCGRIWYPIKNHGYGGAIFKVAPNGDSLWLRHYEAITDTTIYIEENLTDLKETKDKGFILCGESYKLGVKNPEQSPWLLKLDSCGCLVPGCWKKTTTKALPDEIKLQTYPNPVSGTLGIYLENLPNTLPAMLLLYDEQGRLLKTHQLNHEDTTYLLDMSIFPSGNYILKVGSTTRKIIKI
jgi:hypothetical protein